MSEDGTLKIPEGWVHTTLGEIMTLNPRRWEVEPSEDDLVSFVPMASVEAISGKIDTSQSQPWSAVKKGYTSFQDGDVLFAKITPSMENGKCAVAHGLIEGRGVGSTEFHVLRPTSAIHPYLLFYFLLQESYRREARARMKGAAGQLRVPPEFIQETLFYLTPLSEQHRIVEEIERRFSQLDAGVAALERAKANLKNYRASVLRAACEGQLVPTEAELARTEEREYEPADQLLTRILKERRTKWEADQLAKMEAQGKAPKDDKWKAKYKEPAGPDTRELSELPEGWVWATLPQLGELGRGKSKHRPRNDPRLFGGSYPFIQTADVRHSRGLIRNHNQTYNEFGLAQSRLWPAETLCITIAANIAETGILTYPACFPDSVVGFLSDSDLVVVQFIERFLRTAQEKLERFAPATAQKNINLEILSGVAIPLPPLPEQHRIVAEFEDRLSILDRLEATITASLKRAERLRQAILKQAFEGELVPQDPNDEPASVLLERIREERARKAEEERAKRKPARKKMAKTKRGSSKRSQPAERKPLLEVLNSAAGHLTPEQLFSLAGYETNDEEADAFYEELNREVLAQRIKQERPNDTEVYLRAVGE